MHHSNKINNILVSMPVVEFFGGRKRNGNHVNVWGGDMSLGVTFWEEFSCGISRSHRSPLLGVSAKNELIVQIWTSNDC
jgi:hypothetical protein